MNLVVLSFVHPLKLLNKTTDAGTLDGVPRGMTPDIVDYFKSRGVRVMLSIGGITYTKAWNQALAQNADAVGSQCGGRRRAARRRYRDRLRGEPFTEPRGARGVHPAYRAELPYDPSGINHAARLTIDLAAGDRWLIDITRKATAEWLNGTSPLLDYANAMVPARQPSVRDAIANWQEHVDGKPQYAPPILPLAPARFTGSVYLVGSKVIPECNTFAKSLQSLTSSFVRTVAPNATAARRPPACSATCSGPRNARARAASARCRRTAVRVASVWGPPSTRFRCRCRR